MPTYRKNPEAVSKLTPRAVPRHADSRDRASVRQRILDNKEPGLYVDVVSGEPLFASLPTRRPCLLRLPAKT